MNTPLVLALLSAVAACLMALAIAFYERRSIPHWFFVLGMIALATESVFAGLTAYGASPDEIVQWQNCRLVALAFLPGVWLLFSLSYARGNHRGFLDRWRMILVFAFGAPIGLALFFRGHLILPSVRPGTVSELVLNLTGPGIVLNVLFLVGAVLVVMNLESTFRAAVGTMRWRIKFMVIGLSVLFAVRIYTASQNVLYRSIDISLQTFNSGVLLLACLLIMRSVMRAGNFEVSVYPSQAVLQNSLTLLLAGAYLLTVGALAKIVTIGGGEGAFQLKAFLVLAALVLLTILLLSDRVRLHISRFVSRHFQRPQYDYREVWRTFTEGTARKVEQADLCGATVRLVSEVFQALSVTIWLVDESREKLNFVSSTSLSLAKAEQLTFDSADARQVIAALAELSRPVDLDSSREVWAAALRRLHPDEFRKGGNRVCVPMIAGGELLGVMMLGDRVGGLSFTVQDFDLLASAADQAATSLLNIRLSQRLSQAKQLEAFQSMSTFFVHDLKNTASTLSLMLQNLPVHFNDPSFREDALRGISKTVTRINDLIGRLGLLRQELVVRAAEGDLNQIVTEALGGLATSPGVEIQTALQPLTKVQVDSAKIQNVVTNLVLNAADAVGADGRIKVETSQRPGWAVLSVTDNGCGISPEFIRTSLFRPFQTTKKKGMGIGMFQCKIIVEAHRGRIEVESELGKGTIFRVLLPAI